MNYCPNCGASIGEGQDYCLHCGKRCPEEKSTLDNKKIKLWIGILLAIVVVVIFVISSPTLFLSAQEREALKAIEVLQNIVLQPEELRLYGVYHRTVINDSDGEFENFVIDFGAANQGGGITEGTALINNRNGTYEIEYRTDALGNIAYGYDKPSEDDRLYDLWKATGEAQIAYSRLNGTLLDVDKLQEALS